MKLGMQVGLGPRHIALDGDPALPPQKGGRASPFLAHVHCGQMAGWITMALGMEVGLGPGHIVLNEDPAPLPQKGAEPLPNFWPMSIVAKCWLDQDATWYGGKPQPRRRCVRWGSSSP